MKVIAKKKLIEFIKNIELNPSEVQDFSLLNLSLTHKSYAADFSNISDHNERLEFVGDAILGSVIATLLFQYHPKKNEAEMTLYKIALVREETLAIVAKDIGIQNIVLISKGEEKSGGREKPSILSDTLEALIGYIAIDLGYDSAYSFVKRRIYSKIHSISANKVKSYKAQFQELIQKKYKTIPHYVDTIGADGDKQHTIHYRSDVFIGDELVGSGFGSNKKKAQESAAENAINIWITGQSQANK